MPNRFNLRTSSANLTRVDGLWMVAFKGVITKNDLCVFHEIARESYGFGNFYVSDWRDAVITFTDDDLEYLEYVAGKVAISKLQLNSATAQQRNSATAQQRNSATAQQRNSATAQQHNSPLSLGFEGSYFRFGALLGRVDQLERLHALERHEVLAMGNVRRVFTDEAECMAWSEKMSNFLDYEDADHRQAKLFI